MATYLGITFRKGYTSFAEFKNELSSTHVFKAMHPDKREAELKKAYKIATKDELSGSTKKRSKSKPSKGK